MELNDKRLLVCAGMVEGDYICDVGTDHGLLPAYLLSTGKCCRAAAADINPMPLEAAKVTAVREGVYGKMDFYLSDGLREIPLEGITDIVIAGMGGELIYKILSDDERVKSCGANFILQPMTKAERLRKALAENGFETVCEMGAAEGRFAYCVIKCVYTGVCRSISHAEEYIGRLDPEREDDKKYIIQRLASLEKAADGMAESAPGKAELLRSTAAQIRKESGL